MNTISSISLSGMYASQTRVQASSHNIANLNTPNFTRQEVTQSTQAGGGTIADIVPASSIGNNMETDIVQQLDAKNVFTANLSAFKAKDNMLGSLLNIMA